MFRLLQFVKRINKGYFYCLIVCYFVTSVLPFVQIRLVQQLIDTDIIEYKYLPYAVIAGLVVQQIAFGAVKVLIDYVSLKLRYSARTELNDVFLSKCDRMAFSEFENSKTVKNIKVVRGHFDNMCCSSIEGFFGIVSTSLTMLLILSIILEAGWMVVLVSAITLIPVCIFSVLYSMKEMKGWDESGELWEKASYYSGIITSREYGKESRLFRTKGFIQNKWKACFDGYNSSILKMTSGVRIKKAIFVFVQCLAIGVVICFLLSPLKNGLITIGCLIGTVEGLFQLTNNVGWDIALALSKCTYGKAVYNIYNSVAGEKEEKETGEGIDWENAYNIIKSDPVLKVDDIWFRYDKEKEFVLKGVSFTINLGKKVLLVGENGAGKTTLIKLILGLYKPEKGRITIGGYDVDTMPAETRYKVFSAVFQDYAKYEMSLNDNLEACTHKKYEEKEVASLLEKVDGTGILRTITDIREPLGKKYEDGKDLSNGQWQKVAIIRATSKEYCFLLMDEPTAAQDPMAEIAIYRNLIKYMKNKTGLLITHRLGAAKYCDSILVLKEGKISEEGTHRKLMENHRDYWEMYNVQKEWYDEDIV